MISFNVGKPVLSVTYFSSLILDRKAGSRIKSWIVQAKSRAIRSTIG